MRTTNVREVHQSALSGSINVRRRGRAVLSSAVGGGCYSLSQCTTG